MEMSVPAAQLVCVPFYCSTLRRNVILTSICISSKTDEDRVDESNQTVVFDCAEKKFCGVYSEWGRFRSYDWTKCSHPDLKKPVSK